MALRPNTTFFLCYYLLVLALSCTVRSWHTALSLFIFDNYVIFAFHSITPLGKHYLEELFS